MVFRCKQEACDNEQDATQVETIGRRRNVEEAMSQQAVGVALLTMTPTPSSARAYIGLRNIEPGLANRADVVLFEGF